MTASAKSVWSTLVPYMYHRVHSLHVGVSTEDEVGSGENCPYAV